MLYACDGAWWRSERGVPNFAGLKVTQDGGAPRRFPDVQRVRCRPHVHDLLFENLGEIGWGGNGGFHATNLAFQFGVKKIVFLGIDCSVMSGLHWHGRHAAGLNNPKQASVDKWRERFDAQRPILDRLGLEIVIGSPGSALTAYRKLDLTEALYGH